MTDPLLAIVSPVFTINGELVGNLARDCVRLEVTEGSEGLRTLQAHFLGVGPGTTGPPSAMLYLDGSTVDFGKSIHVSLGPPAAQRIVFEGTISGIEAVFGDSEPPRVVVYAEDALMRLRMTRRMRSYKDVTDAEVAAQIAGEHGLQTEVAADGPRYKILQQVNQSDLAFLRERARLLQAEVWCTGRILHFTSRPRRQGMRGRTPCRGGRRSTTSLRPVRSSDRMRASSPLRFGSNRLAFQHSPIRRLDTSSRDHVANCADLRATRRRGRRASTRGFRRCSGRVRTSR